MADSIVFIEAFFAQGYGCLAYGETKAYNSCEPTTQATAGAERLINTGSPVMIIASMALILIAAALIVKFARQHKTKQKGI